MLRRSVTLASVIMFAGAGLLRAEEETELNQLKLQVNSLQESINALQEQGRQARPNLLNPALSAAVDGIASYSDAGDNLNFTPRDVELMIQANADPFAKAYLVLNAESELNPTEKTDPFAEVSVGMEEAAIQTTALPYGLAVKAGAFFADFTRLGKAHSHDLPFVDRPPSLERIIGGEDKARGVEVSWLPPLNHYLRLTAGLVDDIGAETAINNSLTTLDGEEMNAFVSDDHRSLDAATYYGRAATLFELGESAVLHLGADVSQGGQESTRSMASADFMLEWKPDPTANDRIEVAGEWLTSKHEGTLASEALTESANTWGRAKALGGYLYAQYRTATWEPGVRFDYTKPEFFEAGDAGLTKAQDHLYTYSAYLTAYLSEFNRLRLQVNYVQSDNEIADGSDSDTQIFLQWSVALGAHKHDFMP